MRYIPNDITGEEAVTEAEMSQNQAIVLAVASRVSATLSLVGSGIFTLKYLLLINERRC